MPALLTLTGAECAAVRPELTSWLRETLNGFGPTEKAWVLDFLDSKHADVRQVGWTWLLDSPVKDETDIWHKLIETPYDDVRTWLDEKLAGFLDTTNTDTLRILWATVLLSIHRSGRQKPGTVAQIVARLDQRPEDAPKLLPLLAVAVRSLRGPEFRAGLTGVVMLSEIKPELLPAIRQQFPELTL